MRWKKWAGFALVVAVALASAWLVAWPMDSAHADVGGYVSYARDFFVGNPLDSARYQHALPNEYPPLALAVFALTLLPLPVAPALLFIGGYVLLFLVGGLGCWRFFSFGAAARYAVYLLVGGFGMLFSRYDLAPALLVLVALWCAERKRFGWAYLALALGAALKLYPLALFPVFAITHYRARREDGARVSWAAAWVAAGVGGAGALVAAALFLPAWLTNQPLTWVGYATERPVQIESVLGSVNWLGTLLGLPVRVDYSYGSEGWVGGVGAALSTPALALGVLGCLWVLWRQARGQMSLGRAALAVLCLVLVSSRVLSAQYLIWVLPVAALTGEFVSLWVAIAALTCLDYPTLFPYSNGILPLDNGLVRAFMLAVALRNALLLLTTTLLLVRREATQPALATTATPSASPPASEALAPSIPSA